MLDFTIPQGKQGIKGDKGEQGIQGPKGDKGDKGDAASLDNLVIGGRNLAQKQYILGFDVTVAISDYIYSWSANHNKVGIKVLSTPLVAGKSYVFSYKFKKTDGIVTRWGGHMNSHKVSKWLIDGVEQVRKPSDGVDYDCDDTEHKVVIYFAASLTGDSNIYIQPNRRGTASQYSMQVCDIQIEEGTIPTDWTPAIEDYEDRLVKLEKAILALGGTI